MRTLDRVYHVNELLCPDPARAGMRNPYVLACTKSLPQGEELRHERFVTHEDGMAYLERLEDNQRLTTLEFKTLHPEWKALLLQ